MILVSTLSGGKQKQAGLVEENIRAFNQLGEEGPLYIWGPNRGGVSPGRKLDTGAMAIIQAALYYWTPGRDSVRQGKSIACAAPTRQTMHAYIYPENKLSVIIFIFVISCTGFGEHRRLRTRCTSKAWRWNAIRRRWMILETEVPVVLTWMPFDLSTDVRPTASSSFEGPYEDTMAVYHGKTLEAAQLTSPPKKVKPRPYMNAITPMYAPFASFTTEPGPNLTPLTTTQGLNMLPSRAASLSCPPATESL